MITSKEIELIADRVVEKLKTAEHDREEYYESGLYNAWECLKWIARKREEAEKLFCMSTYDILMDMTPTEVLSKITAYEKQKFIKVGDAVELKESEEKK